MALRLIEVIAQKPKKEKIKDLKNNPLVIDAWQEENSVSKFVFKFLVEAERSEEVIDKLSRIFEKEECSSKC